MSFRFPKSAFIADLIPHGFYMGWPTAVVSVHVLADALIALSYFCIPLLLLTFVRKRPDVRFHWIFLTFALFILACGSTYVMEIVTLWLPLYRIAALLKAITALVSLATAFALFRMMPHILALPTPHQMSQAKASEQALMKIKGELEIALQLFQETFENTAIGLAHIKPDGRFLLVNRELCRLLGYSAEELLLQNSGDLNHPDDLAQAWALALSLLAGEISNYTVEKRYRHKDASYVWVNLSVSLIRDASGNPSYFIAATRNITEKREAESRLQATLETLSTRDRQLAMVFEQGALGDFTWNVARNELTAHPIVWRLYGAPDERGPKPAEWFEERQHPADRPAARAIVQAALEDPAKSIDLEFRIIQPDWSIRWVTCRAGVIRNDCGEPIEVYGLNIDISQRKRAEAAVRASEKQLMLLTEILPQILWFNDRHGNIEFFNQRWYDYTGNLNNSDLNRDWQAYVHPQDLPDLLTLWQKSLETATPHEAEFRLQAKDGSYRWHLSRAQPLLDETGIATRWFGSFTDIEAIKAAEARVLTFAHELEEKVNARTNDLLIANDALLQARMRLQSVLDSATEVAVVALDRRGVIQIFNSGAERMLQYDASDVLNLHTPALFFMPEHIEQRVVDLSASSGLPVTPDQIFECGILPDHPYTREAVQIRSDGVELVTNLTVTPMIDGYGKRIGTLGISVDITKRKLLELQLMDLSKQLTKKSADAENANRAQSEFLAAMSHEIRTPMNAILGMADLLWESDLNERQRHYVQVFRRAGANLLTLVNDILDLSKIESGHFELEQIDFDLRELVERTVEMIHSRARAKRIDLMSRIVLGTPTSLVGDPSRLQQILINLLGNAIKFTHEGEVTLTISTDPANLNRLHFEISDSGIGIPEDKLESIFEDFTQAEASTTRRFGGTGLGLGICRRLVNRMGGQLKVRSEFGKGSTFYFNADFAHSFQINARRPEGLGGLAGRRVLIVDNNATNCLIFTEMCSSWGMIASQCSDAIQVADELRSSDGSLQMFDLIIVDRLMPGMDGFELTSHIRKASIQTPILMATSDQIPGDETKGQVLGIAGYTVKPVRRSELLRLICKALGVVHVEEPEPLPPEELKLVPFDRDATGRILIAEDSEDNRLLFEAYFENTSYRIDYAQNGAEAVRMAFSQTFDLILMDIQMPIMDGVTATRRIREIETQSGRTPTPVLALTANARLEDVEASRQAGCNAHLSKPISKPKLLSAVRQFITQS